MEECLINKNLFLFNFILFYLFTKNSFLFEFQINLLFVLLNIIIIYNYCYYYYMILSMIALENVPKTICEIINK